MNWQDLEKSLYAERPKLGISKNMAKIIKNARLEANLTQYELAKRMGTKQESIARIERGHMAPSLPYLQKMAKALGKKLVLPKFE